MITGFMVMGRHGVKKTKSAKKFAKKHGLKIKKIKLSKSLTREDVIGLPMRPVGLSLPEDFLPPFVKIFRDEEKAR